ncbi:hypothetical protein KJ870_07135 [bacterium]|nr:hypothetical protein [bacterium]MBU1434693.1 hypothetical protein [bacterium]MBU1502681.1 hypothetical protein [bacterium]
MNEVNNLVQIVNSLIKNIQHDLAYDLIPEVEADYILKECKEKIEDILVNLER